MAVSRCPSTSSSGRLVRSNIRSSLLGFGGNKLKKAHRRIYGHGCSCALKKHRGSNQLFLDRSLTQRSACLLFPMTGR